MVDTGGSLWGCGGGKGGLRVAAGAPGLARGGALGQGVAPLVGAGAGVGGALGLAPRLEVGRALLHLLRGHAGVWLLLLSLLLRLLLLLLLLCLLRLLLGLLLCLLLLPDHGLLLLHLLHHLGRHEPLVLAGYHHVRLDPSHTVGLLVD